MKKWLKRVEDGMAAAAFAEAGEFETAKDILKEQRKILLALTGKNSDLNAFKYAQSVSKRLGAEIEILYSSEYEKKLLKQFRSELNKQGIDYKLIEVDECIKAEILRYTEKRKDILFVILESSDGLDLDRKSVV